MTEKSTALRLADAIDPFVRKSAPDHLTSKVAADELRRLYHNNQVLTDALWKACGDDEEVVNGTIESQGELK